MMRFVSRDLSPLLSPDFYNQAIRKNAMMKVFAAAVTSVSTKNTRVRIIFLVDIPKNDSNENIGF